jgi:hypothetical protein
LHQINSIVIKVTHQKDDHVVKTFMIEKEFLIFYTQWLQKQDAETFSKEWVLNRGEWYTNEQLVQKYLSEMNKKAELSA